MPSKPRKPRTIREYRFVIDSFTPETIPMARLAQYLGDLARMMGEPDNVHFTRLAKGSTVLISRVEWEAEPKVLERLRAVRFNNGPLEARRAYKEINRRLVEDNANGVLMDPGAAKIIRFPGRDGANQPELGPIVQSGVFQGVPIRVGGERDPVPVHLEDGETTHIIWAPRRVARLIAPHLFTSVLRIEGKGRWVRNKMGEWQMLSFHATDFEVLRDSDLKSDIAALRAIPAAWKESADPLADLMTLRTGERPQ